MAGTEPRVLKVPSASGDTELSLLGSAAEGEASGRATLTYTDGTTQRAEIGFSDWTLGGGAQQPSFGNTVAVHTTYRDVQGGGTDPVGTEVFATAPIALRAGKQLASVPLPSTHGRRCDPRLRGGHGLSHPSGTGRRGKAIPLPRRPARGDQTRSNRSRFMTLSHAATKSFTNFSLASSLA